MSSFKWAVRERNYAEEREQHPWEGVPVSQHPLIQKKEMTGSIQPSEGSAKRQSKIQTFMMDPLSSALEGFDPLSQIAASEISRNDDLHTVTLPTSLQETRTDVDETREAWQAFRTMILMKFTTAEKLSIVTSFLEGGEKLVTKPAVGTMDEKMRHRLQQLDEADDHVSEHRGLSQEDYVLRINELGKELHQAWREDQRVKALKIVIQCSKLLTDTRPAGFYPSKFVLVSDILDQFGKLVFQRIAEKSDITLENGELPAHFKPQYLLETARETCRNWIYKIASIRELLPRLYVEMAIFKCNAFLTPNEMRDIIVRLSNSLRGIGNPLVAAYARCYLLHVAVQAIPNEKSYLLENFTDFLMTYRYLFSTAIKSEVVLQKLDFKDYLALYTPAIDWMAQTAVNKADVTILEEMWKNCLEQPNGGLLWQSLLTKFPPYFIAQKALHLVRCLSAEESGGASSYLVWRQLGLVMSSSTHVEPQMFQETWKNVARLDSIDQYLQCVEAWMPYIVRNYPMSDVDAVLGDIMAHACTSTLTKESFTWLTNVMNAITDAAGVDFFAVFSMRKFLPFLDLFPKGYAKADVSKSILHKFLCWPRRQISNANQADSVVHLAKILHDHLNAMSVEDEKRQISDLVNKLIDAVDFGRDFQQLLEFYTDARGAFCNLEPVLVHLVHKVNSLMMTTLSIVRYHNAKTSKFVRACAAYVFITVAGITCPLTRLSLYVLSAQVALANQCIGQGEACFEAAISLITEVSPADESVLSALVSNLLSALLVQPDNIAQGRLHLIRRLIRTVRSYSATHNLVSFRTGVFLQSLRLLSASAQENYIYHIPNIESNDQLYLGDPEYKEQIVDDCTAILGALLEDLKNLGNAKQYRQQASLCLDLIAVLLTTADLEESSLANLVLNLFALAQKYGQWDFSHAMQLVDFVQKRAISQGGVFAEIASNLRVRL